MASQDISKPRLTYFGSRGLAETIRVILIGTHTDYEEVSVGLFNSSNQPEAFRNIVKSGILPFDSLPLYEEPNGVRIVQSNSIIRYLAKTKGLEGSNITESYQCDMLYEELLDFRAKCKTLSTVDTTQKESVRLSLIEKDIPKYLNYFESWLKKNNEGKGFFVGDKITYFDFAFWYFVCDNLNDQGLLIVKSYPAIKGFKERMDSNEALANHKKNPNRYPIQPFY